MVLDRPSIAAARPGMNSRAKNRKSAEADCQLAQPINTVWANDQTTIGAYPSAGSTPGSGSVRMFSRDDQPRCRRRRTDQQGESLPQRLWV